MSGGSDRGDARLGAGADRGLQFHDVPGFRLEAGEVVDVRQAYRLVGTIDADRRNVVLLFHSLTGNTDAAGWWPGVVGPGLAIDTLRYAVVCPNLLGSCYGTTYRRAPGAEGPRPAITTRDQARLAGLLLDHLGVAAVALASGGSLGGMVTLEWAASFPGRARLAIAFASPAVQSAYAQGWNLIQRRAIELGGEEGLAVARMVGMMTYRTADELDARFLGRPGGPEPHAVQTYLRRHGEKLVERFDTESYLSLMETMDGHDVGRGRGGVGPALRPFEGRLVGVGIPGDLLYRDDEVKSWAEEGGAAFRYLASSHGHDGFLLERRAVAKLIEEELLLDGGGRAARPAPASFRLTTREGAAAS